MCWSPLSHSYLHTHSRCEHFCGKYFAQQRLLHCNCCKKNFNPRKPFQPLNFHPHLTLPKRWCFSVRRRVDGGDEMFSTLVLLLLINCIHLIILFRLSTWHRSLFCSHFSISTLRACTRATICQQWRLSTNRHLHTNASWHWMK